MTPMLVVVGLMAVAETNFQLDCMANDPAAQSIIETLKMTQEQLKELSRSILSIKVFGVKPA